MNYQSNSIRGLSALLSTDGSVTAPGNDGYLTLGVGTYFIPLGSEDSAAITETALVEVQAAWDANLRATITVEFCDFPATLGGDGRGGVDVKDWDASAANFLPAQAADGRVQVATATATALSIGTITGIGSARWTFPDCGARRARLRVAVTTQGKLRALPRGKLGS